MKRLAGRIILLWGWRRALAAFLAGAVAVLTQAPFDFFAAGFVAFPVLVWLLDGASAEPDAPLWERALPAFAVGWWFGFGYFVAGLWWVGNALLVDAEGFAWAIPLAVTALPAFLAMFYGAACAAARLAWTSDIGRIAALAAAFAAAEWLRGILFTGFPWNPVGYGVMPVPLLMQSVAAIGVIGINALAVFVFATPALLAGRKHLRLGFGLAALLIAAHVGYGYWRLAAPPSGPPAKVLAVRIVQPAVLQSQKWDTSERDRIFNGLLELSGHPGRPGARPQEVILWPETSVPFLFSERPDALSAIRSRLKGGQLLLAGAVRTEADAAAPEGMRYYNAILAIDSAGEIVDAVDKVHLVPFGEYVPFEGWLAQLGMSTIVPFPQSFSAASSRHPLIVAGAVRAAPFICYEIIFPDLVAADSAAADLIVNVTNDAWFGNTPGPYQHFRQAQIRAVETGLPVIRAANTGISGYIDAHGRIVEALGMNRAGVIDAEVRLTTDGRVRFGPLPQPRRPVDPAAFGGVGRSPGGVRPVCP